MERIHSSIKLQWLLLWGSYMVSLAMIPSNVTDQSALLAFKSAIENNALSANWTTETNFCQWIGVSCSIRRQRVTVLDLRDMGLQGTIPPHLGNLSFLVELSLGNNSFHGYVPNELGNLRRLKLLVLEMNQLEGVIPSSLCHCRALQIISLTLNNFSGGIPEELVLLPELNILYLGGNDLSGNIPWSLGNISSLRRLTLEGNRFTGSIPSVIFNLTSLMILSLRENFLSGSLPIDMCKNSHQLQTILLGKNQLSGSISSSFHECRELRELHLNKNRFHGSIPAELGNLTMLQLLDVDDNNLSGTIPASLWNVSSLEVLSISGTSIHGNIPEDVWPLKSLVTLELASNALTGVIPDALFNSSTVNFISLAFNSFSGELPSTMGLRLPNLEVLHLQGNVLSGKLPLYLSNCSKLTLLHLEYNLFSGTLPPSLGNLQLLRQLNFAFNQLTGEPGTSHLNFLTALTSCRSLEALSLEYNPLNGVLPSSVGNSSGPLQILAIDGCQLHGKIPNGIGLFDKLILLVLSNNNLMGVVPSAIGGLKRLQRLFLENNMLEGLIPAELCQLNNLGDVNLASNNLSGSIPSCIGNLSHLQTMDLSSNGLATSIPSSLWNLGNIVVLNLSANSLSSNIPEVAKLDVIENLDLSSNQLSGNIPSVIGSFQRLSSLNLSNNLLQGNIPGIFGNLVALEFIDLSYNDLSGVVPKSLEMLKYLKQLNLSYNKLSGEIPSGGPFANFTAQSFLHNAALCGKPALEVPPCKASRSNKKAIFLKYVVPIVALLAITFAGFCLLWSFRAGPDTRAPNPTPLLPTLEWRMISYQELLRATDNFSEMNSLGAGSFSSAYKGSLSGGLLVAVKVLDLQLEGAFKSFDAECKVFQIARHRNLVKVISSCSNLNFRALILEYMSNGSVEKWLYSHNYFLNLQQRVDIMVDVALALEYLHHGLAEPIIHCDIKPSNILLNEDMVAHVGDFGIAKILKENKTVTQTKILGTLGYIALEYGSEGNVSTKCDVYSFGIMLLEIFTRKKPTDEIFSENLNLRQWVVAAFPNNIMKVIDHNLLSMDDGAAMAKRNQILDIFKLGLECSNELTEERSDMKEVAKKMRKIQISAFTVPVTKGRVS